jgi:predicted nucleic acid-binding Zn ribbon protein
VPGASEQTRQLKVLNANWVAGSDGADGRFQVLVITDDDQRHVLEPSPAAMAALVALARTDTVLAWDPTNRTLIAANVVGTMPWTERGSGPH